MGKSKRKAEKAAKSVLGAEAAKAQLKPKSKAPKESKSDTKTAQPIVSIQKHATPAEPPWRNKEKPLLLCARGITYRYRYPPACYCFYQPRSTVLSYTAVFVPACKHCPRGKPLRCCSNDWSFMCG